MNNHVHNVGGVAKGKIAINLEFSLNNGIFEITAAHKVTKPKAKRGKTIAWSTPDNNFTQVNPRQMDMFKVRDVTTGEVRNVRDTRKI